MAHIAPFCQILKKCIGQFIYFLKILLKNEVSKCLRLLFEILTRVRPVRIAALHKLVMMAIISSDETGQKDAE